MTCARIRNQHEIHCLEHTKPLFNEHKIHNLENLYYYHIFMEIFKTSMSRNQKLLLMTPKVQLEESKQNFVFKAAKVCNKLNDNALERNESTNSGLIIPGSARNSDLSASLAFVKG